MGAGHETIASGLSWTLWLLASNLEVQQQLRDEVGPVLADNSRPDYKTLKEMRFLECVMYGENYLAVNLSTDSHSMESLRVMPPAPMTVRRAEKTAYLGGHLVPKGTLLHIGVSRFALKSESTVSERSTDTKCEHLEVCLGRRR